MVARLKCEAFQRRRLSSRVGVAEFFNRKISVTGQTRVIAHGEIVGVNTLSERSNYFREKRHAERAHYFIWFSKKVRAKVRIRGQVETSEKNLHFS